MINIYRFHYIDDKRKTTILYFVGNKDKVAIKPIFDRLLTGKSATEADKRILSAHYTNYEIALEISDSAANTRIIYGLIADDMDLYTVKYALIAALDISINIDHIYLWCHKRINQYEFMDILAHYYYTDRQLSGDKLRKLFRILFNIDIDQSIDKKQFDINLIYNLYKLAVKYANLPLEIRYIDKVIGASHYINADPFHDDADRDYTNDAYNHRYDTLILLKNKCAPSDTIYFTTSNNIYNYYKSRKDLRNLSTDDIFATYISPYFPDIKDGLDNYYCVNNVEIARYNAANNRISDIVENNKWRDKVTDKICIQRLYVQVYPILISAMTPNKRDILDLTILFNNLTVRDFIPVIYYNRDGSYLYRININLLSDKHNYSVTENDIINWTKLNTADTDKDDRNYISIFIYIDKFNKRNKFVEMQIFSTGIYRLIYTFSLSQQEYVDIADIYANLQNINDIIDTISHEYNISLVNITKELLQTNIDSICTVKYNIKIYKSVREEIDISRVYSNISYYYPYFDPTDTNNNAIRFKKCDNYIDRGDMIISGILNLYKNGITNGDDISAQLYSKYGGTNPKFTREYIITKYNKLIIYVHKFMGMTLGEYYRIIYMGKGRKKSPYIKYISKNQYEIELECSDISGFDQIDTITNIFDQLLFEIPAKNNAESQQLTDIIDDIDMDYNYGELNNDTGLEFDDYFDMADDADIYDETESVPNLSPNRDIVMDEITDSDIIQNISKNEFQFLARLKQFDKDLFVFDKKRFPANIYQGYSQKCQKSDMKYPIVITAEQKAKIDELDKIYGKSYGNYVKTGSTAELVNQNFYICPQYWCRLDNISINQNQYDQRNGVCPSGDKPVIIRGKGRQWLDKSGKDYIDGDKRFAMFTSGEHPLGYKYPCCGRTVYPNKIMDFITKREEILADIDDEYDRELIETADKRKIQNYNKDDKRILAEWKIPTDPGRRCLLPPQLQRVFGDKVRTTGYNANKNDTLFIKYGIDQNRQRFITCMLQVIYNENIGKDLSKFNELLNRVYSIKYHILHNGGHTVKLYMSNRKEDSIYIPENFSRFVIWFLNFDTNMDEIQKNNLEEYIEYYNLENVRLRLLQYLEQISGDTLLEFHYNPNDPVTLDIIREYMIYQSYINYKSYLIDDNYVKTHEDLYYIFVNIPEINIHKYNIIMIEYNLNIERDKDELYVLTPINMNGISYPENPYIFILYTKHTGCYEPIIQAIYRKDYIKNKIEPLLKYEFNYYNYPQIKPLVDNIYNFERVRTDTYGCIRPYNVLYAMGKLRYIVKFIVINAANKICGIFYESRLDKDDIYIANIYIPLNNQIYTFSYDLYREINDMNNYLPNKISIMYLHNFMDYCINNRCNMKLDEINNLFLELNKIIDTKFYDIYNLVNDGELSDTKSAFLMDGNNKVGIVLKSMLQIYNYRVQEYIIPLNITSKNIIQIKNIIDDYLIYLDIRHNANISAELSEFIQKEAEYTHTIKMVSKRIRTISHLYKELEYLKHPHNPLSSDEKLAGIQKIIVDIIPEIADNSDGLLDRIANEFLVKEIEYVIKQNNIKPVLADNEILYTLDDINNGKLTSLIQLYKNPYKGLQYTVDDYINFTHIKAMKILDNRDTYPYFITIVNELPNENIIEYISEYRANIPPHPYDTKLFMLELFSHLYILSFNDPTVMKNNIIKYLSDLVIDNHLFLYHTSPDIYLKWQLLNPYYKELLGDKTLDRDIIERIIMDPEYKYSLYELTILSKRVNNYTYIVIDDKDIYVSDDVSNIKIIMLQITRYNNREIYSVLTNINMDNQFILEGNNDYISPYFKQYMTKNMKLFSAII